MDYTAHYERACELADEADELLANSQKSGYDAEYCLRRAEVMTQMAKARFQGAWVAFMGADLDACRELVKDAKKAPMVISWPPERGPKDTA